MSRADATPDTACIDGLWRPARWREHIGGDPLGGFFAGVIVVAIVWNLVANLWLPSAAWVPANCAVAVVLVVAARRAGMSFEEIGLRRDRAKRGVVVGAVAAGAVLVVLAAAVAVPQTRGWFDDSKIAEAGTATRVYVPLVRISLGTVVLEETLFRGVLLALALRRWPVVTAVLVTAVLFGLWHVVPAAESAGGGVPEKLGVIVGTVVFTTVAGTLFAWLRLRANSVVAPMVAHTATNSLAYLAVVIALELH